MASEAGVGSTFAFYVKARRSESSDDSEAIEARLSSDMESNARLATDIPRIVRDQETSISQQLLGFADSSGASPQSSFSPKSDPNNWHVLIVEDNLVNQRILAAQISKIGCTTHVANHGEEALDMIRRTKHYKGREEDGIDLSIILMDLEMPVMGGLACAQKIREMESEGLITRHLPIIAVTANARGEQVVAAKNSGMVSYRPLRDHKIDANLSLG